MTLTAQFDHLGTAVVATDPAGVCTYANDTARGLDAGVRTGSAVPSAVLDDIGVVRLELADTGVLHVLRPETADDRAAASRFDLRSADALAGILNLRRTLHRIVDLARDGFGGRAGIELMLPRAVRSVHTRQGRQMSDEVRRQRDLDPAHAAWLEDSVRRGAAQALLTADHPAVMTVGAPDRPAALTTVPLRPTSGGRALLWVVTELDACPRLGEVENLARRASVAVSSARVYEERAELASTLRAALLPAPLPSIPGVQLGAAYRPAQETTQIGGDFYDVTARGNGTWTVSIGDVCGKGVEAAVLTGRVRQSVRTATLVTDEPDRVLGLVNDTLRSDDGSTFVTLIHGRLRVAADGVHLRLANGGHLPPLLLRDGRVESVPVRGTIVGMLPDIRFEPVDVHLGPGDALLLFTDGAPEARGADGLLDMDPIVDVLSDCDGLTAQAIAERVAQLVLEHLDGREHDDIALVAVRAEPTAT